MRIISLDKIRLCVILSISKDNINERYEMARTKIEAGDLRAALGRHRITRRQVARALNLSEDYIRRIVNDGRSAQARRAEIMEYIKQQANKRGA